MTLISSANLPRDGVKDCHRLCLPVAPGVPPTLSLTWCRMGGLEPERAAHALLKTGSCLLRRARGDPAADRVDLLLTQLGLAARHVHRARLQLDVGDLVVEVAVGTVSFRRR